MSAKVETLAQLFVCGMEHASGRRLFAREDGVYVPLSSAEFYRRVARLHIALRGLGFRPGDCCVLFSENRWEWVVADFAVLTSGMVSAAADPSLSAEQVYAVLKGTAARAAVVSGREQREKVLAMWGDLPALDSIIICDGLTGGPKTRSFTISQLIGDDPVGEMEHNAFTARVAAIPPDATAVIAPAFTGGRLLESRMSHRELADEASRAPSVLAAGDVVLSTTPLYTHEGRVEHYRAHLQGAAVAYLDPGEMSPALLGKVRPTRVVANAEFFTRLYTRLAKRLEAGSSVHRRTWQWALEVGYEAAFQEAASLPLSARVKLQIADQVLLAELRGALGGQLRQLVSLDAPIPNEQSVFFAAAGAACHYDPALKPAGAGTAAAPVASRPETRTPVPHPMRDSRASAGIPFPAEFSLPPLERPDPVHPAAAARSHTLAGEKAPAKSETPPPGSGSSGAVPLRWYGDPQGRSIPQSQAPASSPRFKEDLEEGGWLASLKNSGQAAWAWFRNVLGGAAAILHRAGGRLGGLRRARASMQRNWMPSGERGEMPGLSRPALGPDAGAGAAEPVPSPLEGDLHALAQRWAKSLVEPMVFFRAEQIQRGKASRNIYGLLKGEIDQGYELYQARFGRVSMLGTDYYHLELVRALADGDEELMGPAYPFRRKPVQSEAGPNSGAGQRTAS